MLVHWSVPAIHDLRDIEDFISLDNPERAVTFVDELIAVGDSLENDSICRQGHLVTWSGGDFIREIYYKKYTIVYEIQEETVYIHEVYNQAKIRLRYGKRD